VRFATSEKLGLIQIGRNLDYDLNGLIDPISARYSWIRVIVVAPLADPTDAYNSRRNQYHSTRILVLLERQVQRLPVDKLLGVVSLDLYVPNMNFVFGEARLPGRVGVISTCRLKPQSLHETEILHDRVVKEAIHEIGHMIGLRHCSNATCVMHFSERLADTDLKSPDLCKNCQSKLRVKVD
jgi:archaemetzincin